MVLVRVGFAATAANHTGPSMTQKGAKKRIPKTFFRLDFLDFSNRGFHVLALLCFI